MQGICDLLKPGMGLEDKAALALAEYSTDPILKEEVGQASVPALLEILEDASADETVLLAAAVAVGVLCRDCPANRCPYLLASPCVPHAMGGVSMEYQKHILEG